MNRVKRDIEWVKQNQVGYTPRWVGPLMRIGSVKGDYSTFPIADPTTVSNEAEGQQRS